MKFPKCKNHEIRKALAFTAKDIDTNGCDVKTGFGLVQAHDAFKLLKKGKCGRLDGTPDGGCYKVTKRSGNKPKKKNNKIPKMPINKSMWPISPYDSQKRERKKEKNH